MMQQYDFLNDSFTVFENVETPKVTKLELPLGNIDVGDWGYVSDNGSILANDNLEGTTPHIVNDNNPEQETSYISSQNFPQSSGVYNLTGNKKKAMEFFKNKGFSTHAAAGLVGGLMAESSLNPNVVNKKSGAIGIAQWLGERKKRLISKYGKNPTFEQQLDFIWEELNSSHKKGLETLKNSKSVEEAAANAFGWFEFSVGPEKAIKEMQIHGQDGVGSYNQRIKYAKSLLS